MDIKNIGPVISKIKNDNKTGPSCNNAGDITNMHGKNTVIISDKNSNIIND